MLCHGVVGCTSAHALAPRFVLIGLLAVVAAGTHHPLASVCGGAKQRAVKRASEFGTRTEYGRPSEVDAESVMTDVSDNASASSIFDENYRYRRMSAYGNDRNTCSRMA